MAQVRALLVVNPVATTTSPRAHQVLVAALEADLVLDVVATKARGHASELGHRAREEGVHLVVTLGGDGTVNEIVNGLLADGPYADGPALAVVPGGGTNVFARSLGIPPDPVEATGALLERLRAGQRRCIGLGRAESRWFTCNAGMGPDAAVVARVDSRRRARPDRPPGPRDYVTAALRELYLSGDRRRPPLTVHRAGAEPLGGVHLAVVANTSPWTYLGHRPLLMSPEAGFDSGLDLYALTSIGTVRTLAEVRRLVSGHTGRRPGHVHREHDLSEVRLNAQRPVAAQVDGEFLGLVESLTMSSVPRALRVIA